MVVAGLLLGYVVTYSPPRGITEPSGVLPAGLAMVAALVALSVWELVRPQRSRESLIGYIAADGALTIAFVGLFAFDPQKYLFAMAFAVVLEAALLLGLRAAVLAWGGLSLAYSLKEALGYSILDVPTEPIGVILRLVVLGGVALTTGSLVEANRATRAFSEEREETERLRDLDEMKTAFLAAVSHDLKNPLTAILGFSTTLQSRLDRLPPERSKEFLGHITNAARKLQRMLDDLLDIDRMNRGTLEPHRTPTDIGSLVRRTVEETDMQGRPVAIAADEVTVNVDPAKVERIVENLITNAVKYTPDQSPIHVRVEPLDGGVLIAVDDRGEGIRQDQKLAVFDPFHRAPGAEKVAKGTGVGLSLVSSFAELHGGRAWVEDRPGGGASFQVFLPDQDDAL